MDEMNPKMTEFLAQDRIAGFKSEAARHHLDRGTDSTIPKTTPVPVSRRIRPFATILRRVRGAIAT
jgi:hypothetical protein